MQLKDQHVFITGANRGMGQSFAETAAQKGAHVHVIARRPVDELLEVLKQKGAASAHFWKVDMGDMSSIDQFCEQLEKQIQSVDILINNAGQLTGGLLEEQPAEKIVQMLQVNLIGLIHLTRKLLPAMLSRKKGKIVNNASVSGVMYMPCASTYAASKAGVVAFTKSLQEELKGTGVSTLLLLTPGVKTDMYDQISDLYGGHLDLSFLSHMSSEEWSERVFDSIERDKPDCLPKGSTSVGLWMARHTPGAFNSIIRSKFSRK